MSEYMQSRAKTATSRLLSRRALVAAHSSLLYLQCFWHKDPVKETASYEVMPEPVTCLVVSATCCGSALHAAGSHVRDWFRGHAGEMKDAAELEKARLRAAEFLRQKDWHCSTCPCVKFLQVVPQVQESLLDILKDPVFQNSDSLKTWMEHQLKQTLKLKVGSDDFKSETVQSVQSRGGTFHTMMAVIFARVVPCEESTPSPLAKDTAKQVAHRLKQFGSKYHAIAELLKSDGIDGHFLANNDITREMLAEDYDVSRKIQQDVLLNLFGKYKPTVIHNVAIGVAACSAEFSHKPTKGFIWDSSSPLALSHEDLKIRAQKMMAYQSASKALGDAQMNEPTQPTQPTEPALDDSARREA